MSLFVGLNCGGKLRGKPRQRKDRFKTLVVDTPADKLCKLYNSTLTFPSNIYPGSCIYYPP